MPYVDGESLRQKLDRDGQLPVEEAVRIAGRVADALDSAHRNGVIHRDLKPGNILFQEGEPVVADFGIALAVSAAGEGRLTETGLSLGTPYYMSPEQAAGDQTPTAASDVYSLGCVLYEMLTGEPPHTGASAQAILGKILLADVTRPTKLRRTIPANVEGAVLKALERLPADRFEAASELAAALKDKAFRHGAGATADAGPWKTVAGGLTAVIVLLVASGLWMWPSESPRQVSRFSVTFPAEAGFVPTFGPSVALSPDGSSLVYVGPGDEGGRALWLKETNRLQPRRLPGTEGATVPFFSPDGQRVGFIGEPAAHGLTLKSVSLRGGPPTVLGDSGVYRGGASWGADGYVYSYGQGFLVRVSERGGKVEDVTTILEGETTHLWPDFLPSGRGVLYTVMRHGAYNYRDSDIAVVDLENGRQEVLTPGVLARYVETGHILVLQEDGTLLATPFDQDNLTLGDPIPIVENVLFAGAGDHGGADIAVSRNGALFYVAGQVIGTPYGLAWVERDGTAEVVDTFWPSGSLTTLALSPDDRRLAIGVGNEGVREVWVKGLVDGTRVRLTMGPHRAYRPVWSADGTEILYTAGSFPEVHIRRIRSDGSQVDSEVVLERDSPVYEVVPTPDEQGLLFREGTGNGDLFYLDLETDSVQEVLATEYNERAVALSPDGRWIAYVSDVTGQPDVFVRPFKDPLAHVWPVSTNGGAEPVWAHNGGELFYRDLGDDWLVAASYAGDSTFVLEERKRLFFAGDYQAMTGWHAYDVTRDDQRFVFLRPLSSTDRSFIFVQNFFTELEERAGRGR
jgi:serine/threonine-protein kinase